MRLKKILRKGLAIGGLALLTSMSVHANPKYVSPQEIPLIDPSRLIRVEIIYSEEEPPVIALEYDTDNDNWEDVRIIYQILPVDESSAFTRVFSYAIDWNKDRIYGDAEIRYIDWGEDLFEGDAEEDVGE